VLDTYQSGVRIEEVAAAEVDPPTRSSTRASDVQASPPPRAAPTERGAGLCQPRWSPRALRGLRILQGAPATEEHDGGRATGPTSRFLKVLEEYKKAPRGTLKRLYLRDHGAGVCRPDKSSRRQFGQAWCRSCRSILRSARRGELMLRALAAALVGMLAPSRPPLFALFVVHVTPTRPSCSSRKPVRIISERRPVLEYPGGADRRHLRQAHPRPGYRR